MKIFHLTLLLPLFLLSTCQTDKTTKKQYSILLPKYALFKTGDSSHWADTSYHDTHWKKIKIRSHWFDEGYDNYKGTAWYRIKINIPSEIKKTAYFKKFNTLYLYLGKIGAADQTFFNVKK